MSVIKMEVTPTGRTLKGPGFVAAQYGSVPMRFPPPYGKNLREFPLLIDFAELEIRMLGMYTGNDPRNHFGKYALREF